MATVDVLGTNPIGGFAKNTAAAPKKATLLITTVDIGDGKSDKIEFCAGDDPMDVAAAFVQRHGLPPSITAPLAQHILDNLKQAQQAAKAAKGDAASSIKKGSKAGQLSREAREVTSPRTTPLQEDANLAVVYNRLYQHAIALRSKMEERREALQQEEAANVNSSRTAMSWISAEMMRERSSGAYDNYGEMLYAEGLEVMARRRDRATKHKESVEAQEVQGATFHPEITKMAQNLWERQGLADTAPAWQRLSKAKKNKTEERLEMLRQEKAQAETRECTFRPKINNRSERLMNERSETLKALNLSAHEQLYQDSVRRQQKQQEYASWYPEDVTFQPKLYDSQASRDFLQRSWDRDALEAASRNSAQAGSEMGGSQAAGRPGLVERLYSSYDKLQRKLEEARLKMEGPVDPQTGKRLYHPETGRAPHFSRNTAGLPVGEYLHSIGQEWSERKQHTHDEEARRAQGEAAASKITSHSAHIIHKLKIKRYKQIFEFLDQNHEGSVDLGALMEAAPQWLDDLDDEVRADVELAAKLSSKPSPSRTTRRTDSHGSNASSINMPGLSPAMLVDKLRNSRITAQPPIPAKPVEEPTPAGAVGFNDFCKIMDAALNSRRCPRAYLAPSPPPKYVPSETFKPQITERSKQLAARLRPKDMPVHEVLHQESYNIRDKLEAKRREHEEANVSNCTFAPRLVSHHQVKEGRIMRSIRDGTYAKSPRHQQQQQELLQLEQSLGAYAPAAQDSPLQPLDGYGAQDATDNHIDFEAAGGDDEGNYQDNGGFAETYDSPEPYETEEDKFQALEREVQEMLEATHLAAAAAVAGANREGVSEQEQQRLADLLDMAQLEMDAAMDNGQFEEAADFEPASDFQVASTFEAPQQSQQAQQRMPASHNVLLTAMSADVMLSPAPSAAAPIATVERADSYSAAKVSFATSLTGGVTSMDIVQEPSAGAAEFGANIVHAAPEASVEEIRASQAKPSRGISNASEFEMPDIFALAEQAQEPQQEQQWEQGEQKAGAASLEDLAAAMDDVAQLLGN